MPDLYDEDVERTMKQIMLAHISDDEMGSYHDEAIDDFGRAHVEAHLRRCLICSRKYERMQRILVAAFEESAPPEKIDPAKALVARMQLQQALAAGLIAVVIARARRQGARAADQQFREVYDGQSEDGSLLWRVVEDDSGIVARFWSHRLELEGLRLRIKIGSLTKEITLKRVTNDQVGGQARIEGAERQQLPDDWHLFVESVTLPEPSEAPDSNE